MEARVPGFMPMLLLAGAGVLVYAFLTFDRLVRAQYELHREAWLADGQPSGFFWRAPETRWFASTVSLHRIALTWFFSTPTWVAESPAYHSLLKRIRMLVGVLSVLLIGGFIAL